MDLAEDGSGDGTSTPTERDTGTDTPAPTGSDTGKVQPVPTEIDAGTAQPAPTEKYAGTIRPEATKQDAGTIRPTPTEKVAATTPPAPTGKQAGTTSEKPTYPKRKGTPKPDRPAIPGSESKSSDDDDTEDEEYVSCFLQWLSLDPDCKRMLDDETKMLAHHERKMGNKALPIFPQAVNEEPELFSEGWADNTTALYAMPEAIVRSDTRLGNISYFPSGQGKRMTDTDGGKRKRVRME